MLGHDVQLSIGSEGVDLLLPGARPVSAGVTRSRGCTVDENEALMTPDD